MAITSGGSWPEDANGFRLRGMEMTRTETFTDAAFAFAVTLLVIATQSVPENMSQLLRALTGVPAFGVSFAFVMVFWYGHWKWSRRYGMEDLPSILLSATLVFTTLIYVYPLKFLYSVFMEYVSGGRATGGAYITTAGQLHQLFAIYGSGYVAMNLVLVALNAYAYHRRRELHLDELEQYLTRAQIRDWLLPAVVGSLSVALALFTRPTSAVLPGWVYVLLAVIMPIHGSVSRRRAKLLRAAVRGAGAPAVSEPLRTA